MRINYHLYTLERIDGKLVEVPYTESKFKTWIKSIILWCFKKINSAHVNAKDDNGRLMVQNILDIRGLRTCSYETIGGQVIVGQFMWKIGKYYI